MTITSMQPTPPSPGRETDSTLAASDGAPATFRSAKEAFLSGATAPLAWRRQQLEQVVTMLTENADLIRDAVVEDLGKHPSEAHLTEVASVVREAQHLLKHLKRWTRDRRVRTPLTIGTGRGWIQRQPLGAVLVIGAWNYPIHLSLMPVIGALAAGNAVVLKPSEVAPASSRMLAELTPRYLDTSAVHVVEGGVDETTALLDQPWDHVFYTGNGKVGSIVMEAAAKHLTPVTLELGGKSPAWVDGTASLEKAARAIVWGKFTNAGQTCVAPDYVLTTRDVAAELAQNLTAALEDSYGPDPRQSPDYSRIVSSHHAERLAGLLDSGTAGRTVTGGAVDVDARYVAPTILLDVDPEAAVMQEEIFGPILPIVIVDDLDAGLAFINARPKPLSLYVFTGSRVVRDAFSKRTSSGSMVFNHVVVHLLASELPFGGVGGSGMGSYHGEHSIRTFSHERAVFRKGRAFDPTRLVRPPFNAAKSRFLASGPAMRLLAGSKPAAD
ncbi:aldehyde dehydrogenase family protein [Demequina sp. NBRC 110053]|uniref:aldehyde dehydrogenase family protein n=1 Tax=Demequina sp. NBRC 110053 TaxID=1570342 RepID=UPI001F47311A|nr:aldehyde dehydrogenase family protein [Demequina sp. NBRC 110053]